MSANVFTLPRPKAKFFLGHLPDLSNKRLEFLTKCSREYGDIVPLRLGNTKALFLNHPEYVEQVLNDRQLFIKKGAPLRSILGEGLLTSVGESWFRQRRLIQPVFHQKQINTYAKVMVANTEEMLETWQNGATRDVNADMMSLTLSIVVKTIFSIDLSDKEAKTIAVAVDRASEWFQKMPGQSPLKWLPTPESRRLKRAIEAMDKTIYNIINQRRNSREDKHDLLSMLMQARDEADGSFMNDEQLRDEVATLIIAGHETTANALSWTWTLLSEHPQVETKLLAELTAVLGDRAPTMADIANLPYTNMVIKEAMRLYPPVPMMIRRAARDCEIGGYSVPTDCPLLMSQWAMHRDPRYFQDPDLFTPERWAGDLEKRLPKGVYFPFGDGPRICIGKNFALMEAVLILATIAPKFKLTLLPGHNIVPQAQITLRPKGGIKVVLIRR